MVGGLAIKDHGANTRSTRRARSHASIGAGPIRIKLVGIRRDHDTRSRLHWRHQIYIVSSNGQMHGARTDIADQALPALEEFALHIDVPIHNIRAAGILLHEAIAHAVRVETYIWIDSPAERPVFVQAPDLERSGGAGVKT